MSPRTRLALLGPASAWDCVIETPTETLDPLFVDLRAGDPSQRLATALEAHDPDVIAVLAPELVPIELLAESGALTVAFVETAIDASTAQAYDRVVACSPQAQLPDGVAWRTLPLPVNDAIFDAPAPAPGGRIAFFGPWTPRTEYFLLAAKHSYEILHIDSGATAPQLLELFATVSVAIHVNDANGLSYDHRVLTHLAAGHVLVCEPLWPRYGLAPGIDYVEVGNRDELHHELGRITTIDDLHRRARLRGRRAVAPFRASRVYERLVFDLRHDVAAFGD